MARRRTEPVGSAPSNDAPSRVDPPADVLSPLPSAPLAPAPSPAAPTQGRGDDFELDFDPSPEERDRLASARPTSAADKTRERDERLPGAQLIAPVAAHSEPAIAAITQVGSAEAQPPGSSHENGSLQEHAMPWNIRLPSGEYRLLLTAFEAWGNTKSEAPLLQKVTLQRDQEGHVAKVALGKERVVANIDAEGKLSAKVRRGDVRGRIQGTKAVIEFWEAEGSTLKKTGEWRATLPPPCEELPQKITRSVSAEEIEQEVAAGGGASLGILLSLVSYRVEACLSTGELVSLPARGAILLTLAELDCPHVQELTRACVVEVRLHQDGTTGA
jgi:hypothetical protein